MILYLHSRNRWRCQSSYGHASGRRPCRGIEPARKSRDGQPGHMAPKQILGERVCRQTDQYVLAVVLYEMVSGRGPWDISSQNVDVLAQVHAEKTPKLLIQVCPRIPQAVSAGIGVASTKSPKERWPTILQFADALRVLERPQDPHHHRSRCPFLVLSRCSSPREDVNSPGPGVVPKSRRMLRPSQLWTRCRATSQNPRLPIPRTRQIPHRWKARLRCEPNCRAISHRVWTQGRSYVRFQARRRGRGRTACREASSAER